MDTTSFKDAYSRGLKLLFQFFPENQIKAFFQQENYHFCTETDPPACSPQDKNESTEFLAIITFPPNKSDRIQTPDAFWQSTGVLAFEYC